MTASSVDVVLGRIGVANAYSPIAVFRTQLYGQLDARFYDTIVTRRAVRRGHPDLVGVYTREDLGAELKQHLTAESRRRREIDHA